MKIAALYDIHGNVHALRAVLADVAREQPDAIVIGGDIVLGPFPLETLALLEELRSDVRYIRGNTEREVLSAGTPSAEMALPWAQRAAWVRGCLSPAQAEFLGGLPEQLVLDVDGLGPTLFCHGSPRRDDEIVTYLTTEERLSDIVHGVKQRAVVLGHTHVQFDRSAAGIRVMNSGSVGMAYEKEPGAYWALLGDERVLRHSGYDVQAAATAVSSSGFPDAEDFARRILLEPSSPEHASVFFEHRALDQAKSARS